MRIPHDRGRDPFAGCCPYHGDCFEGLASGEALRQRFGVLADELLDPEAWALEADYIALGRKCDLHAVAGADHSRRWCHERAATSCPRP
jgi:ROK family